MAWDTGITGTALDIAATDECPLRVMAGPGTGKSYAMKRRVARLLESGQAPDRILAVTFTRNAAASLVEDLHALGIENCELVKVGTLHSFCFSLLMKQDVFDYLGRTPRPLAVISKSGSLQFEARVLLDDLVLSGQYGNKRDCTRRIRAFEADWARLQSETPGWPVDPIDQLFNNDLVEWLRFHGSMMIGELVPETLRYLRDNPASDVMTAFDHVIVDEYQDLNKAEQVLIDLISSNGRLAIVGDVDQSIYSFRHANPEGIDDFSIRHNPTHDETLDECRRCPTSVVEIANNLICKNYTLQNGCRLQPMPGKHEGEVHIVQWDSVGAETNGIASYIGHLIGGGTYTASDFLVLTPRRVLGYAIRDKLLTLGVSAHSFYHEEAHEGETAQRGLILLALLANPDDSVSLRWWLGDGNPRGRSVEYLVLRKHCEQAGTTPREALQALSQGTLQLDGVRGIVAKFQALGAQIGILQEMSLDNLVDTLFPANDDSCAILREVALGFIGDAESVAILHEHLRAYIAHPEVPENSEFVRIMSLHKSKGLTSKVTIVTGCLQGMVPHIDTEETPSDRLLSLKEQRRLFYVAITRCTELLVVSSPLHVAQKLAYKIGIQLYRVNAGVGVAHASQFISELGPSAPRSVSGKAWVDSGYSA